MGLEQDLYRRRVVRVVTLSLRCERGFSKTSVTSDVLVAFNGEDMESCRNL